MTSATRTQSAPPAAAAFGLAGLIPFVGLATLVAFSPAWYAYWLNALLYYGAVILSFVGALQWGYAVKRDARGLAAWIQYGWSVIPALVAWSTLLVPVWTGLRVQAAALIACYAFDRAMSRTDPVPAWVLRLRAVLTAVASASLAVASLV